MAENLHDIDRLFYNSVESLTEKPSPLVWHNIETLLDRKNAEKKRSLYAAFKKTAIVLCCLLIAVRLHDLTRVQFTPAGLKENNNTRQTVNPNKSEAGDAQHILTENKHPYKDTVDFSSLSNANKVAEDKNKNLSLLIKRRGNLIASKKPAGENSYIHADRSFFKNGHHFTALTTDNFRQGNELIPGTQKNETPLMNNGKTLNEMTAGELQPIQTGKHEFPVVTKLYQIILQPECIRMERKKSWLKPDIAGTPFANRVPTVSVIKPVKNERHSFHNRFQLTTFASPEIAGYNLRNDLINSQGNNNKEGIKNREKHLFSFSSGVLVGYKFKNNFTVQSGATYSHTIISIAPSKIFAAKNITGNYKYKYNLSSGYTYITPSFSAMPAAGDSLYTTTAYHTLQSISIPFLLKYRMQMRRFTFNPGIGVSVNILTGARVQTIIEKWSAREKINLTHLDGLRKINVSLLIDPEMQYQFSKSWGLSLLPYLKYALTPINIGATVKTYPYHIGLGIGAVYFIKQK